MGLSIVGDASLLGAGATPEPAAGEKYRCEKYREKARDHLQKVLSGVLHVLAAASGEAAGDSSDLGDLGRATWHLQMVCNYLKLAASETGTAEADAVDTARESLTDRFFWLQASLVRHRGVWGHEGLLEGLEVMAAVSSLLPPPLLPAEAPASGHGQPVPDFF